MAPWTYRNDDDLHRDLVYAESRVKLCQERYYKAIGSKKANGVQISNPNTWDPRFEPNSHRTPRRINRFGEDLDARAPLVLWDNLTNTSFIPRYEGDLSVNFSVYNFQKERWESSAGEVMQGIWSVAMSCSQAKSVIQTAMSYNPLSNFIVSWKYVSHSDVGRKWEKSTVSVSLISIAKMEPFENSEAPDWFEKT
jgi:hypothetical protein